MTTNVELSYSVITSIENGQKQFQRNRNDQYQLEQALRIAFDDAENASRTFKLHAIEFDIHKPDSVQKLDFAELFHFYHLWWLVTFDSYHN